MGCQGGGIGFSDGERLKQMTGADAKFFLIDQDGIHPKCALRPGRLSHWHDARNIT
jgi:hypothetical protein